EVAKRRSANELERKLHRTLRARTRAIETRRDEERCLTARSEPEEAVELGCPFHSGRLAADRRERTDDLSHALERLRIEAVADASERIGDENELRRGRNPESRDHLSRLADGGREVRARQNRAAADRRRARD